MIRSRLFRLGFLFLASWWIISNAPAETFELPAESPFKGTTVEIPMRDGKNLAGDCYVPKQGGRFPVILIQTPYDKAPMRMGFFGGGQASRGGALFTDPHYAFVTTDWRGRGASKDALNPGNPPGGMQDGVDTIEWIVKQEWCNGKIGTWGPSALAGAQYKTASGNPPNLVCCVPMVAPLNLNYDVYFQGGVLWEEYIRRLGTLGWDLYGQIAAHPSKDLFWRLQNANLIKPDQIKVPMLLVGGWYDIYPNPVLETYQTLRTQAGEETRKHTKIIIGPWLHRTDEEQNGALKFPKAVKAGVNQAHKFFDHWLLGADNGYDSKEAAITYYQMGSDEWETSDVWPPKSVKDTNYYLTSDGGLSSSITAKAGEPHVFKYDPKNPVPTFGGHVLTEALSPGPQDQREKVESRDDTLEFTTPVFDRDVAVAGMIRVKLFVSSDRTDTDLTATLTDVHPDGRSMLLAEGIQRMRYRNGPEIEELIKPGDIYAITITLNNTANVFLKGHKARVIISSSNFPKYAKNLNDGGTQYVEGDGVVATNKIYHDAEHPSALILPVDEK